MYKCLMYDEVVKMFQPNIMCEKFIWTFSSAFSLWLYIDRRIIDPKANLGVQKFSRKCQETK